MNLRRTYVPDRCCSAANGGAGAFTLIELLLSIVIFAVVLTAVNGVLFGAMRLRNKTSRSLEQSLPIDHLVQTLRQDFASVLPPGGLFAAAFRTGVPTGSPESGEGVEFHANNGNVIDEMPFGNLQRIAYVLRSPTNNTSSVGGGKDLVRLVTRSTPGPVESVPDAQWLLDEVRSLQFSFFDGTQWRDTWDSASEATVLPLAVKVLIGRLPPQETGSVSRNSFRQQTAPIEMLFPIMVTANTNQADGAADQAPEGQQGGTNPPGGLGAPPTGPAAPGGGEGRRP